MQTLYRLSLKMRQRRFDNGVLSVQKPRLSFVLDADGRPTSSFVYPMKDSNRLVEEFMLLANQLVAVKIQTAFPDRALLRRHPEPEARGLAALVLRAHELGIELDVTSSKSFQVRWRPGEEGLRGRARLRG